MPSKPTALDPARYDDDVIRRPKPCVLPLYASGAAEGEARLAAGMIALALHDAQAGDARARAFVTSPERLELWAANLSIPPARLAELAVEVLEPAHRSPARA